MKFRLKTAEYLPSSNSMRMVFLTGKHTLARTLGHHPAAGAGGGAVFAQTGWGSLLQGRPRFAVGNSRL